MKQNSKSRSREDINKLFNNYHCQNPHDVTALGNNYRALDKYIDAIIIMSTHYFEIYHYFHRYQVIIFYLISHYLDCF